MPTLLRLAIPNVVTTTVQGSTGLIDIYFIGKLGTDALAGVSLVFPGADADADDVGRRDGRRHVVGDGARARRRPPRGRRRDHAARAGHRRDASRRSSPWPWSPADPGSIRALGGSGGSLDVALTYSNIVFGGVILIWMFNMLANIIRGTGNTFVPAVVTMAGAALLVPLSPCADLRLRPAARAGRGRRRHRAADLLRPRYRDLRGLSLVGAQRGAAEPARDAAALAAVLATSCGSALLASLISLMTNVDHRAHHRRGRRVRRRGDRRLRRRHAAGISAGAARRSASAARWWRWSAPISAQASASGRCAPPGSAAGCRSR